MKQNNCIRSIFVAHSRDNATPYYNLEEILKLENIYKFKVGLFTQKKLNMIQKASRRYSLEH